MKHFVETEYKKIIWAIDPKQNPEDVKELIKALKAWSKSLACPIQPVSVFSKSFFEYPIDLALHGKKNLKQVGHEIVERYLKDLEITDVLEPEILFSKDVSNHQMALVLSRYAEKSRNSLIFVNTREKKTRSPIRIGGFAEALIATSRVPVFCLNPSAHAAAKVPTILFATDFSSESRIALARMIPLAKAFQSKVIIYNQVEYPKFYAPAYNGYFPSYDWVALMKDLQKQREKTATEWGQELERHQIKCDPIVRRQRKRIGSSILELADQDNVNLIVMASHSSPWEQVILGSTPRDVMLLAKCPVLIFHRPKAVKRPKVGIQVVSVERPAQRKDMGSSMVI